MTDVCNRTVAPRVNLIEPRDMPAVDRILLSNGVELAQYHGGQQPISRLTFCWPIGLADVEDRATLMLLKAMLLEGTRYHSGEELAVMFETLGTWTSVDVGRHVLMFTVYMLNRNAGEVLPLINEVLRGCTFVQTTVDALKEKYASQLEVKLNDVRYLARQNNTILTLGERHPLSKRLCPLDYKSVEREHLASLYTSLVCGCRPTVYIAGMLDDALLPLVHGMVEGLSFPDSSEMKRRIVPAQWDKSHDRIHSAVDGAMQTALNISIPSIDASHADYNMLRIGMYALGGYFGSRFMTNIREDKGYTYGISAQLSALHEGAFTNIVCETDNKYVEAVKREIGWEIDTLCRNPMPKQETEIVRRTLLTKIAQIFDSPFAIMDQQIMIDVLGPGHDNIRQMMETLMSMTSKEVSEVVGRHLLGQKWLVASAGGDIQSECS